LRKAATLNSSIWDCTTKTAARASAEVSPHRTQVLSCPLHADTAADEHQIARGGENWYQAVRPGQPAEPDHVGSGIALLS
jgi:hypothetical protein